MQNCPWSYQIFYDNTQEKYTSFPTLHNWIPPWKMLFWYLQYFIYRNWAGETAPSGQRKPENQLFHSSQRDVWTIQKIYFFVILWTITNDTLRCYTLSPSRHPSNRQCCRNIDMISSMMLSLGTKPLDFRKCLALL